MDLETEDPTTPVKPNLEGVLAAQANEAMKAGADPKATTDRLGKMVAHIRANPQLAQHGTDALAQGADPAAVTGKVWEMVQAGTVDPAKPGVMERAGTAIKQTLLHPIDALTGAAKAVGQSAYDTFAAPVVGEVPQSDLAMLHGTDKPVTASTPNAITPTRFKQAAAQTVVNAATPSIAGAVTKGLARVAIPKMLATAAGSSTAGAAAGAVNSPDDPATGAVAGAVLAPVAHAATNGVVGAVKLGARGASAAGGRVLDIAGRPAESGAFVEGATDRAARLNAPSMQDVAPPDNVNKPLTPLELGGTAAVRLARGLKTSSPAAEAVLRDALHPRAEQAVDRVIQHGLETTGLTSRENGLGVVDDMIAQRAKEAGQRYPKTFAKYDQPIDNPELDAIAKTPAGQQALKRGMTIAANRGEKIGEISTGGGTPPGYSPEQWADITKTMQERGMPVPEVSNGSPRIAPTLQQAHYIKLGFDDMLNSAPEPGSGGSGPNNAAAIRGLKSRWLAAMDQASPEYAADRKTYADQSDLVDAAKLGRNLFKMHPQEAAKAIGELPQAAQEVARRTGFDALAERIENGPSDIDRGLKVRDRQRMRLLFPDAASFETFKQGLEQEAQMHATHQAVLGGSNTADKMADMADMAGVTLPGVLKAMKGNPLPLLSKVTRHMLTEGGKASADALAAERAKLLVAGANGDASARAAALGRMGIKPAPEPEPAAPAPVAPIKLLPAARFQAGDAQHGAAMPTGYYRGATGDVQEGPAMPIGPLPKSRRLASGPPVGIPTEGVRPVGPIQAPNRLLPSGGPAAVATAGDTPLGPGIPLRGQLLDDAVKQELSRLYRSRPALAVSMAPEEQVRLEAQVRAKLSGLPLTKLRVPATP